MDRISISPRKRSRKQHGWSRRYVRARTPQMPFQSLARLQAVMSEARSVTIRIPLRRMAECGEKRTFSLIERGGGSVRNIYRGEIWSLSAAIRRARYNRYCVRAERRGNKRKVLFLSFLPFVLFQFILRVASVLFWFERSSSSSSHKFCLLGRVYFYVYYQ